MEYLISKTEIARRKWAFVTFAGSSLAGVVLASVIYDFSISRAGYFGVAAIFFILGVFSFWSFAYLLPAKIILSDKFLERINHRTSEKYLLAKINRAKIKWTTRGTIREIYLWLSDGKSVFITGLENFEKFKKDLLNRLDKNTVIKEIHEPIDFDHPLFYLILGPVISNVSVLAIKTIIKLDYSSIKILLLFFSVYLAAMGVYFIFAKPLSKRFGNKTKIADYLFGSILIGLGLVVLFA